MLGLDTVKLDTVESTGVPGYKRLYCAGNLILDTWIMEQHTMTGKQGKPSPGHMTEKSIIER